MENKKKVLICILIALMVSVSACTKEKDITNIEYKNLAIHGDCQISHIGTVGTAYYYSYYSDDKSRCHICRFDLLRNEMKEIKALETEQIEGIIPVEKGLQINLATNDMYIINASGDCIYLENRKELFENSVSDRVLLIDEEYIYIENGHRIICRNIENSDEQIFLDLENYVIFSGEKCYSSDKYFVVQASTIYDGKSAVVIYEYATKEIKIIENRKLVGRSYGNDRILLQNPLPLSEKEAKCMYVFLMETNQEMPVVLNASDINSDICVSEDGSMLFSYNISYEEEPNAVIFCYDVVTGVREEIDRISPCYGIWSVTAYNREMYFLTGQKGGYVVEKYEY